MKTESYARFSVSRTHGSSVWARGVDKWVPGEREVRVRLLDGVIDRSDSPFQKPEPELCRFGDNSGAHQIQLESLILAQNER